MALKATITRLTANQNEIVVTGTITPSVNYAPGGDTLDLTASGATYPAGSSGIPTTAAYPDSMVIASQTGAAAKYTFKQGTTLANGKVVIEDTTNSSALGELGNVAYSGTVVNGDVIAFRATFPKFL